MRWVVKVTPRPLYPREGDSVPIVQEAGWTSRPVWTGAENLAPTGIQFPDRPTRSESLNRLSYLGFSVKHIQYIYVVRSRYGRGSCSPSVRLSKFAQSGPCGSQKRFLILNEYIVRYCNIFAYQFYYYYYYYYYFIVVIVTCEGVLFKLVHNKITFALCMIRIKVHLERVTSRI
jgi:hypothetical protein